MIIDNHRWCNIATGRKLPLPHVFGDVQEQVPQGSFDPESCFMEKYFKLRDCWFQESQYCYTHAKLCPVSGPGTEVDVDVSGMPCTDNSTANNKREFEEGKTGPIYAIWARKHIVNRTVLVILENVPAAKLHPREASQDFAFVCVCVFEFVCLFVCWFVCMFACLCVCVFVFVCLCV
jgi:hypothetical protein